MLGRRRKGRERERGKEGEGGKENEAHLRFVWNFVQASPSESDFFAPCPRGTRSISKLKLGLISLKTLVSRPILPSSFPFVHASSQAHPPLVGLLAVNKQLNDKERVAAALENSHLLGVVEGCLSSAGRRGGEAIQG